MDIGRTVSVYTVEPLVSPVPREREQALSEFEPADSGPEPTRALPTPVENR